MRNASRFFRGEDITEKALTTVLILLAAVTVVYVVSTQHTVRHAARTLNDLGMEASMEGSVGEAIRLWQEAIDEDPKLAAPHYHLAMLYSGQRQASAALLGLTLPELYAEVLEEAALAAKLAPDALDYTRASACLSLEHEVFGAAPDLEAASVAWQAYLHAYRHGRAENAVGEPYFKVSEINILMRLGRIEYERCGRDAAEVYVREALALVEVSTWWCTKTPEEIQAFVYSPVLG